MENKKYNRSDLGIVIDREVKIPLYAQITSHIKELINNGELKEGDVLPSIKFLIKNLGLSKTTVKRAYRELEYEGIIVANEEKQCFIVQGENLIIKNLFKIIEEKGISAKKLSEDTGISTGNISDWKSGRCLPSINSMITIADYLNVSIDYLVGRTDIPIDNRAELQSSENIACNNCSESTPPNKTSIIRRELCLKQGERN